MPEVPVAALVEAIRNAHHAEATFVEAVPVVERFQGTTVWEGVVSVFDLAGHPSVKRAYAWTSTVPPTVEVKPPKRGEYATATVRLFTVVLHEGPVVSPETAVRVAIAARHRGKTGL